MSVDRMQRQRQAGPASCEATRRSVTSAWNDCLAACGPLRDAGQPAGAARRSATRLAVAFRQIAETSLLLKRGFSCTPIWQLRLRGQELLSAALPYMERFPFLGAAIRECLRDYLDEPRLTDLLGRMQGGRIMIAVYHGDLPSPITSQFTDDYINMRIYEDDGLDRAVQAQLLQMSRELVGQDARRSRCGGGRGTFCRRPLIRRRAGRRSLQ